MQRDSCENFSNKDLFGTRSKTDPNVFNWMTYGEFGREVDKCRSVLASHNVGVDDKVAMISDNRVEWAVTYFAANSLGAQIIPMYQVQAEKDWKYIVTDSEAKLLITATEEIYEKTKSYVNSVGNVQSILCFDAGDDYMHSYKRWMTQVKDEDIPAPVYPTLDDLTTIIYTSGTTGNPKGVNLSHRNIISNVHGLITMKPHDMELGDNRSLCFLPWAHVFGLTCELFCFIDQGSSIAICPSREELLECFQIVKPTHLLSVPALFNRIYDGVHNKVSEAPALRQKIFHTAMAIARERNHKLEFHEPVSSWLEFKFKLADKIVMSKLREVMGGKLRHIASGGAASSPKVIAFFEDIGIPVMEGYGLTETAPVLTAGVPGWEGRRLGFTGVALDGVTLKIVDPETLEEVPLGEEGEVCGAGDSIMVGYRNNEEANKEVFFNMNGQKFFRTGDLGYIHDGRFLKITGRIKELYKLENGKYITPVPLEDTICRSRFILQTMLHGANRVYNVALIVPDFEQLFPWAAKQGLVEEGADIHNLEIRKNLMENDEVVKLFQSEIAHACSTMKNFERVVQWTPIIEPFTQMNNMITPKMSMKRNVISKAYNDVIEGMYNPDSGIGFSVLHQKK